MNRGFPIRVNRKDAERRDNHRRNDSDVKVFSKGARHYLHPTLSVLDKIDCELVYYRQHKIMCVSYDPREENISYTDYKRKEYSKCILSTDVKFVLDIIQEYIDDTRNPLINSDEQETIDITMEGNSV